MLRPVAFSLIRFPHRSCPLPLATPLNDPDVQELGTSSLFVHDNDKVLLKVSVYITHRPHSLFQ